MVQSSGGCVAPTGTGSPIGAGTSPTIPSLAGCKGTEPTCPRVSVPGVILPTRQWDASLFFSCSSQTTYIK